MPVSPAITIVVIEDDKQIQRFLRTALEAEGMSVFEAATGRQGLTEAGTRKPDLLIVDLGLPDMDGSEVIRSVRGWSSLPIIVLSARVQENDKVLALDAGADDYLTKPFGVAELMARIRAHLRRRDQMQGSTEQSFRLGDTLIDFTTRVVTRRGVPVHLTPTEYRLLTVLARNTGKVMTHRHLLREVWGPSHAESSHYLRIYMGHLRQKLEDDPAQPRHLITETGIGYRLVALD
ncbi:MAG: DNA-binding response regulator [Gammaproteobacteria bacterium 28-57-27]|nr:MAG: DNA-binding response regulator [Gammaproteobacteria bacterium 28-57-27]